jgi:hypothetical protein
MSIKLVGNASGNVAEVSTQNQIKVMPETSVSTNPNFVGAVRMFWENDEGLVTGITRLTSPEIDVDYRMRISQDFYTDEESFNYTGQNTGKHYYGNSTMTVALTQGNLTTNWTSITTVSTGATYFTRAAFPTTGTTTLSADFELGFSAQPTANTIIDVGFWIGATTVPFAPTDGVYLRLNSAGLQGIANNNGTETSTGVFPLSNGTGTWVYNNNKKYQFIVYLAGVYAEFWVNDGTGAVMLWKIALPIGQHRMVMSSALNFAIRHAIVGGAAGSVIQAQLGAYNVRQWGVQVSVVPSVSGNRIYGSYQGLSGTTQGSLANYANSTNPTAVVPTNTTAALGVGLGGQFWETDTLAVTTDGIIQSYQNNLISSSVPGRRLVIRWVNIDSYVQTALTGGGYVAQYSLAFGHTAVSLATAEAATTKAPRRISLGIQAVGAGALAGVVLSRVSVDLGDSPIFVNPGEFVQVVKKKVGTAPTAGTIAHSVTYVYGWE